MNKSPTNMSLNSILRIQSKSSTWTFHCGNCRLRRWINLNTYTNRELSSTEKFHWEFLSTYKFCIKKYLFINICNTHLCKMRDIWNVYDIKILSKYIIWKTFKFWHSTKQRSLTSFKPIRCSTTCTGILPLTTSSAKCSFSRTISSSESFWRLTRSSWWTECILC